MRSATSLVFALMLTTTTCFAADKNTQAPRTNPILPGTTEKHKGIHGFPKNLKPNQIWVSSIPMGLQVYVSLESHKKSLSEQDLAGTTPFILDVTPGIYEVVMVTPYKFTPEELKSSSKSKLPYLTDGDCSNEFSLTYDKKVDKIITTGRIICKYKVEKMDNEASSVIGLFLPTDTDRKHLYTIYPKSAYYEIDPQLEMAARDTLMKYQISSSDADEIVTLVKHGGKVGLQFESGAAVFAEAKFNKAVVITQRMPIAKDQK